MKTKEKVGFTSGEWKADGRSVYSSAGRLVHDRIGARFVNRLRLEIMASTHEGDLSEEMEANAKLIAAAPELLEVLKRAVENMKRRQELDGKEYFGETIEMAEEAIFKATSQKPEVIL